MAEATEAAPAFQSTPSVWRETKIGVGIAKAA